MPLEITMPQLSDTMTEGTVVKWLKKEGDKVKAGEIVAEVETDKANMEMESFEGGTLAHIIVPEGGKVPVGKPIALLATSKENFADVKKSAGSAPAAATAASTAPPQAPAASSTSTATMERASNGEIHEPDDVGHGSGNGAPRATDPAAPLASVRRRLPMPATRIESKPLHSPAKSPKTPASISRRCMALGRTVGSSRRTCCHSNPPRLHPLVNLPQLRCPRHVLAGQKETVPLTKMRSAIAAQLLKSKQSIPHFYETIDIDVEDVSKLRERLNKSLEAEKIRISIGDIIAKAVAVALLKHPNLNATFNGTEITRYGDVNLGLAVALPEGLIVPVLRGVNEMGLKEIRQRSADLVEKARMGKLKQDERTGATFTVSNLGTYGIREFSAIVNPPEVGILAIAAAEKRAVVRNDQIVARTMLTVTLSADHRVVDGALAAEFLRTLKQTLEEPGLMLI